MFRPASVLVRVAALAAAALCLEASRTGKPPKPDLADSPQAITAAVLHIEDVLDDAESHHRVGAVDELIADDYWGITVGGGVITKKDVLAAVAGTEEASSQSSDRNVRSLGNAAVYTALVVDKGINPKTHEPYMLATRVMDVWQKRGREWKLVNDQATTVNLDRVPR